MHMSALPNNQQSVLKHSFDPNNTLIQHLTKEDGSLKKMVAFFIDEEGETADLPFDIELQQMHQFITFFENAYVGFRDEEHSTLFEISEGLIVFVAMDLPIRRGDVRAIMYQCGMKNVSS